VRPIEELLAERFVTAMALAFGVENAGDPLIKRADPNHADYQSNAAMGLAKRVGQRPREVAETILKHLNIADLADDPKIAGAGFINIRLKREFLESTLHEWITAPAAAFRAGIDRTPTPQTVVVDYSGVNVAKQMHVGHLRSTIIGDVLARTFAFLGHTTVRQNHIGDFGTQFGMLIEYLRREKLTTAPFGISDLDGYYKAATERFKTDPEFAAAARKTVVELQSGGPDAVALWNRMRVETHRHYTEVYALLNVALTDDDERGESFFKDRLDPLVEDLLTTLPVGGDQAYVGLSTTGQLGAIDPDDLPAIDVDEMQSAAASPNASERVEEAKDEWTVEKPFATISGGATCVFLPGYVNKEGRPLPLMVKKSDGGFPYSTTDLAALYFRVRQPKATAELQKPLHADWYANRVIYLVDVRQTQHFAMVFDAFRAAQWDRDPTTGEPAILEHAPFGKMLGSDGKAIKTRSGESLKLRDLIDESIASAERVVTAKNPEITPDRRPAVAQAVGIAAIKYADLRQDRLTDYVFNLEAMIAPEGNTGPYLLYAYARTQSIFRKIGVPPNSVSAATLLLAEPAERELALALLGLPHAVESVVRDLKPHYLCQQLYAIAGAFSTFYDRCPVRDAPTPEIQKSRLALVNLVARTLKLGLETLMGITVLDAM
jgi:arginyl-tRNA synthetase